MILSTAKALIKAALGLTSRDVLIRDLKFQCQHSADMYHSDAKHHAARVAEIQEQLDQANRVAARVPGLIEEINKLSTRSDWEDIHLEYRVQVELETTRLEAEMEALAQEIVSLKANPSGMTMYGISWEREQQRKLITDAIKQIEHAKVCERDPMTTLAHLNTALARLRSIP